MLPREQNRVRDKQQPSKEVILLTNHVCFCFFWKCVCAFLHLSIVYSTITTPQFVQTDWKRTVIQNLQRSNFLNLQMILIIILSREKLLESPSILIRPSVLEIHWRRPSHNLQVKMFIILRRLYLRQLEMERRWNSNLWSYPTSNWFV